MIKVKSKDVGFGRWLWLTLCWAFGFHHRLYYEYPRVPKIGDVDLAMQRLALIFSRGKLTWGKTALTEFKCKVCSRKFWTLTRDSPVCKRHSCYMAFHLHPERYTLRRAK
ncbi:MAG TPA: hypothetical protein VMW50_09980 [Dehalococcoidia bacterium]|nr:hypothetical protein [Dehalococcoidia bacterium]